MVVGVTPTRGLLWLQAGALAPLVGPGDPDVDGCTGRHREGPGCYHHVSLPCLSRVLVTPVRGSGRLLTQAAAPSPRWRASRNAVTSARRTRHPAVRVPR